MQYKKNLRRGILVDQEDEYLLHRYLFHINQDGYARTNIKHKGVFLHKLILKDKSEVDHISRDKLDNRRSNLRYVTHAQNSQNRHRSTKNVSGYKGVFKHGTSWRVIIMVDGRRLNIGTYVDKKVAALEYNKNTLKYHGKFATLNIILMEG